MVSVPSGSRSVDRLIRSKFGRSTPPCCDNPGEPTGRLPDVSVMDFAAHRRAAVGGGVHAAGTGDGPAAVIPSAVLPPLDRPAPDLSAAAGAAPAPLPPET